jgi:hypothetical protein
MRRRVLDVNPETTMVTALEGGMTRGLASARLFVSVMLMKDPVPFLRVQKAPPSVVATLEGSVRALNPLLER